MTLSGQQRCFANSPRSIRNGSSCSAIAWAVTWLPESRPAMANSPG